MFLAACLLNIDVTNKKSFRVLVCLSLRVNGLSIKRDTHNITYLSKLYYGNYINKILFGDTQSVSYNRDDIFSPKLNLFSLELQEK